MPIITVPQVLRDKLGEDGTEALVGLINQANGQTKDDVLTFVEEKFERRLTQEISKVNDRITTEIGKVNDRITTEAGKIGVEFARLRQEMAEMKADLLRWMFIFWVGQIGALLGILFAFFKR